MTLNHILVPVDFGDASAAAITLAGRLASGCGATLTLLHAEAFEAPVYFTSDQVSGLAAERQQRQEQALRYLEQFGRTHTVAPFRAVIVMRPPAEAIVHAAAEADLVVLGTHGRTGARRWWLGSVAERMLRELSTPVLVAHAGDAPAPAMTALAVHAAPGLSGQNALALAMRIGQAVNAQVRDRRTADVDAGQLFDGVSMVVVAEPEPHDRVWRTKVGEPLIRAGKGPVLFVPERR
jgi:nucleotide-binding universal stress UspA family protein